MHLDPIGGGGGSSGTGFHITLPQAHKCRRTSDPDVRAIQLQPATGYSNETNNLLAINGTPPHRTELSKMQLLEVAFNGECTLDAAGCRWVFLSLGQLTFYIGVSNLYL